MSYRLLTYATLFLLAVLPLQAREKSSASSEHFHGIDVSWYQKKIDWDVAARDKRITFAFIKATEGGKLQDANYRYNIENARRKGIKVGSYHFLRPETPAQQQFDNFKTRVRLHEQDLIPVIDIEDIPEMGIRWKPQQARDMLKQMADMIESHYGCRPMIYTSNKFFTDYLGRAFANYPLFIARYGDTEPEPMNGASWTLWQFTKSGRVDGIDHAVDLSRFNKGRSLASIALPKAKKKQHAKKEKKHDGRKHHSPATDHQKRRSVKKHATGGKEVKHKSVRNRVGESQVEKSSKRMRHGAKSSVKAKTTNAESKHMAKSSSKKKNSKRKLHEKSHKKK